MCSKSTLLILMRESKDFKQENIKRKRVNRISVLNLFKDEIVVIFLDNINSKIPKRRESSVIGIIYIDTPTTEEKLFFEKKFPNAKKMQKEEIKN